MGFDEFSFRTRVIVGITLGLVVLTPLLRALGFGAQWHMPGYFDFRLYYEAGLALRQGVPLYEPPLELLDDSASLFYYSPVVALLFVPFTYLSPTIAGHLFNGISIALVLCGLYWLAHVVLPDIRPIHATFIAVGILFYYPSWAWIQNGQITGVIVASVAIGGALLLGTSSRGGELFAIAPAIKMFYLPVGAPLLWSRRALRHALVAGVAVVIISIGLVGVTSFVQWLDLISTGKGWSGQWRHIHTYLPFGILGSYAIAPKILLTFAAAALALWARGQSPVGQAWAYVLGCATAALAVPSPLLYNIVIVYPAIVVAGALTYRSRSPHFAVVWLALLLIQVQPLAFEQIMRYVAPISAAGTGTTRQLILVIQPAQWGILLLYFLAAFQLWSMARPPSAVSARETE